MQFWVRYGKEKTVLGIGTGTGDSASAFAEALPQDGWWVTFEREQDAASLAVSIGAGSPRFGKINFVVIRLFL